MALSHFAVLDGFLQYTCSDYGSAVTIVCTLSISDSEILLLVETAPTQVSIVAKRIVDGAIVLPIEAYSLDLPKLIGPWRRSWREVLR